MLIRLSPAQLAAQRRGLRWRLYVANFVSCIGLMFFFKGFFPVKRLSGKYTRSGFDKTLDTNVYDLESAPPPFNRLVFVVIDALRSDLAFARDSPMTFVRSLIEDGKGLPFTAVAQAPTVTLPRLKALTTGANPTYLDAILNVGHDDGTPMLADVDSWVRQLAVGSNSSSTIEPHRKIIFIGDDTWLRLFPRAWFAWVEGVSSFFVADTIEVDRKVTIHLENILSDHDPEFQTQNHSRETIKKGAPSEWDVLILHYLGLDHIGHLEGSRSPLMHPKQIEMDESLRRMYRYLEETDSRDAKKSLLVIVGDHGMTDAGNHGGSSDGEVSAALLIASPTFDVPFPSLAYNHTSLYKHYEVVQQVDVVPTLSILMGLGIPADSMGKAINSVVAMHSGFREQVNQAFIQMNVDQINEALQMRPLPGNLGIPLRKPADSPFLQTSFDAITMTTFVAEAQDRLLSETGEHHMTLVVTGLSFMFVGAGSCFGLALPSLAREKTSTLCILSLSLISYLATLFATSFIEEEHEFWFFLTSTLFVFLTWRYVVLRLAGQMYVLSIYRPRQISRQPYGMRLLIAAASIRLMRAWSKNGQKSMPNQTTTRNTSENLIAVGILGFTMVLLTSWHALFTSTRHASGPQVKRPVKKSGVSMALVTICVSTFLSAFFLLAVSIIKLPLSLENPSRSLIFVGELLSTLRLQTLYRMIYIFSAISYLAAKANADKFPAWKLASIVTCLLALTRLSNYPLFVLILYQHKALQSCHDSLSPLLFSCSIIALQHSSFFAFGNSNSLATIDLSQAYNGLAHYNLFAVTFLTYISTYCGPIVWAVASSTRNGSVRGPCLSRDSLTHLVYASFFHLMALFVLALSATHFRQHLFAWTVFCPALLYKGIWAILFNIGTVLVSNAAL